MAQYQAEATPPVTVQQPSVPGKPGEMVWMAAPPPPMGCPPGLEYLTQIDQLLIRQQVELFELFTGCEMKNKYQICNSLGQQIYFAQEDTDCCTRYWCGPARPFEMGITDNMGREIIHLSRPLRCDACCYPCCLQMIEVQSPPGTVVGYVQQEWYICKPKFTIKDANEDVVLTMTGPVCACRCCSDVEFPVNSKDGTVPVGKVTKQWTGLLREAFTDADNFGITFPMDLDVKMKAVMLGAVFLIDFMFFEHQQNNN